MKSKKCRIDLFDEDIILFIGDKTKIPKKYDMQIQDNYCGIAVEMVNKSIGRELNIIWMEEYDTSTLLHEISHTIDHILDKRSIKDTETRAYMLEYIYNNLKESE